MTSFGDSRKVRSGQTGIHPRLMATVRRHLASSWRQPMHPGSEQAFGRFLAYWDGRTPLVLDAGCGTGDSTRRLARLHSDCLVVGVDRSAHRLAKSSRPLPENTLLLRARLEDFWRLLADAGIGLRRHYLLYPNPWPKPGHLGRRWHGHPIFPRLIGLSCRLELRSNWRLYLEEFRAAAAICGTLAPPVVSFCSRQVLTPFERKYAASGHALFRLILNLENST